MNNIKFRSWKPHAQRMNYNVSPQPKEAAIGRDPYIVYETDDYSLQHIHGSAGYLTQFTGMKDSNNQDIYKNDLLTITDSKGYNFLLQVIYKNYSYMVRVVGGSSEPLFTIVQYAFGEYEHRNYEIDEYEFLYIIEQLMEFDSCKVIGNIYQNHELLK